MTRPVFWSSLFFIAACAANGDATDDGEVSSPRDEPVLHGNDGTQGATTSSLTWHFDSNQGCVDFFTVPCNPGLPTPQCSVAEGQPCTQLGAWCYKVILGNRYFRSYQCY